MQLWRRPGCVEVRHVAEPLGRAFYGQSTPDEDPGPTPTSPLEQRLLQTVAGSPGSADAASCGGGGVAYSADAQGLMSLLAREASRRRCLQTGTIVVRQVDMSLPITVLASPSTALRDDLVRCLVLRRPRLVAVAYDVEPGNDGVVLVRRVVDAAGTHESERLELTGCCLSCTVREDLGTALTTVAGAERWDEVVLALPASLQPASVLYRLDEHDDVHVDTVTTVVDAVLLRPQVTGGDRLADRGLAAAPTDVRSTAELVLSQLEDADVLAVASLHRVGTEAARTVQALLAHLAPLALQVPLGPGGAGSDELVSTGRHDADTHPADRLRLADLAAELCPEACGVTTVRWRSERPLHPVRLAAGVPSVIAGVVRSRGVLWLADRQDARVRWESAGASLAFGDPAPWRGERASELLLTGVDLDADAVQRTLDACRATDHELSGPPDWSDPFEHALGPRAGSSTAPTQETS